VRLAAASREYRGFLDLAKYLDYRKPIQDVEEQLAELGDWIGRHVFGGLLKALWDNHALPAVAVHVSVPAAAQGLLFRPFELARFEDGTTFRQAGLRFVYQQDGAARPGAASKAAGAETSLRILAAFSLPVTLNPLNLRRERYGLQRLVRELGQTRGAAVELRVLQYGATRDTLRAALEEADGWDVVHLSGHGERGELLLEDDRGGTDTIGADELGQLLERAGRRLKLLILDACHSGAAGHAAARVQIGLDRLPVRQEGAAGQALAETAQTVLPSLAQSLAERLDCAALAMRYPVGDAFATELMLALYEKLLDRHQPLPAALHLALDEALKADIPRPPLSPATPILIGPRAADLQLALPARPPQQFALPHVGLGIAFPAEPERYVGRLQPMLRASQALAPRSSLRGVLFHGIPGGGKTACALEVSYRHAEGRFQGYVWYRAPEADSEIVGELHNVLFEIERQLNAPDLGLTTALDAPQRFRRFTLPRLRAMLQERSVLLVFDNLETLLTASNRWRDPLWGELIAALLDHTGASRVILTSRRVPADLAGHARLLAEPIHALSFAESVLLARELPHLKRLFDNAEGLELLQQTLRVVQGHPKLLELADSLAADRPALAARVKAAADELSQRGDVLDAFFAVGGEREGETRQADADFVRALQSWTTGAAGGLSPDAALLLTFLCRLEPEDRQQGIVESNWEGFLKRLSAPIETRSVSEEIQARSASERASEPLRALGEGLPTSPERPTEGLPDSWRPIGRAECGVGDPRTAADRKRLPPPSAALAELERAGLVAVDRPEPDPEMLAALQSQISNLQSQISDLQSQISNPESQIPDLASLLSAFQSQATTFTIHPGVAETVRAAADAPVLNAADIELGNYHIAMFMHGLKTEMLGGGRMVVERARRAAPYLLRQSRWGEAGTLLERMLQRDHSPATLAFALPLLRRIAEATVGTTKGLENAGILATALRLAGRTDEAEQTLRDVIGRCAAQGNFRLASVNAGNLLNLLMAGGRFAEALSVADEHAGYTRQAGLGPWSRLSAETQRLQVLNAMGRYDEVLAAVQRLREEMDSLPEASEADETANPWNVRETLLDTGRSAATKSARYEAALELNAAIVRVTQSRGADALELASTRFNDYGPLLRLRRFEPARQLLVGCRAVFEAERDLLHLGRVYGALADLEAKTGGRAEAVRFQQIALGYSYQAGQPEDCAISHNNLAEYLKRHGADPASVLAHRLAAAAIRIQIQSGLLPTTLRNLANSALPAAPPAFAEVVARVEAIEGVRFAALFERLPRTAPDGDAAIAAVWQLVAEESSRRGAETQRREEVLASMPTAIRSAIEHEDVAELHAALEQMTPEESQAIIEQLQTAGVIGVDSAPDMSQVVENFTPLLEAIAAVARGDDGPRAQIEAELPQLEENGWELTDAVHRLWAGERDPAALTAGLDDQDAALVRHILQLLAE
jgi:tetratricopeptide (TPR) repeat protein